MKIAMIGVPYNLDQLRVGMGAAPEALLAAGLQARIEGAGHTTQAELVMIPEGAAPRVERIGRLAAELAGAVERARAADQFPLILGGDCLVAPGVLAGLGDAPNTGIAWIDAHGDFNTPDTTISGYLGGMPLACAVGRGLDEIRAACGLVPIVETNVALLDARDLDPAEERALATSGVRLVRGVSDGAAPELRGAWEALGRLRQIYLHVDIDVLDQAVVAGVDFPTPGGLSVAELQSLVRQVFALGNVAAMSLTAVNPAKDADGRTVQAALDVIGAALTQV